MGNFFLLAKIGILGKKHFIKYFIYKEKCVFLGRRYFSLGKNKYSIADILMITAFGFLISSHIYAYVILYTEETPGTDFSLYSFILGFFFEFLALGTLTLICTIKLSLILLFLSFALIVASFYFHIVEKVKLTLSLKVLSIIVLVYLFGSVLLSSVYYDFIF